MTSMASDNLGEIGLRLAKIRIPEHSRGSGYAIGNTGILTARSVIAAALDTDRHCEVIVAAAPDRAYDCTVIWDDPVSDLAIVCVNETQRRDWHLRIAPLLNPALAYPWAESVTDAVAVGFPAVSTSADESVLTWMLAESTRWDGSLAAGKLRGDRAHLTTDAEVFDVAGAPVLSLRPPLLAGVVTDHGGGRRRPRLTVSLAPDPADNSDFAQALQQVGADPIVHNMAGFIYREYFAARSVDTTGTPRRLAEVTDPAWFGTTPARSPLGEPDPYLPFVTRPEVFTLRAALTDAVGGKRPRMVVLRGASGAGTSRLAAEVLPALAELANYQLLAPLTHHGIAGLPTELLAEPTVLWLDDLERYQPGTVTQIAVDALLTQHPHLLIVATYMTRDPSPGGAATASDAELLLANTDLVHVINMAENPVWIRPDDEPPQITAAFAAAEGRSGWGAYVAAHRELLRAYDAADDATRALIDVVVDWDRSGCGERVSFETARKLWRELVPSYLSRGDLHDFMRLSDNELAVRWKNAQAAAATPVYGAAAPITLTPRGMAAHRLLRGHATSRALATPVWDNLLGAARLEPAALLAVGRQALAVGTPQRALRALEAVLLHPEMDGAGAHASVEATARRYIGAYFAHTRRYQQAIASYTDLVDTYRDAEDVVMGHQVAQALLGIGRAFDELGSFGQAQSAYLELVDTFRSSKNPVIRADMVTALLYRARSLVRSGDTAAAQGAYGELTKRYRNDFLTTVRAIVEVARAELTAINQRPSPGETS